jgi:hypothetical protein
LIPSPLLINIYEDEGRSENYEAEYLRTISHTANMYFINEAILTSAQMDLDLFIVCALDEEEFGYVDLTCEFIEEYYKVKPMSAKNYLAGKDMKGKVDGLGIVQNFIRRSWGVK